MFSLMLIQTFGLPLDYMYTYLFIFIYGLQTENDTLARKCGLWEMGKLDLRHASAPLLIAPRICTGDYH